MRPDLSALAALGALVVLVLHPLGAPPAPVLAGRRRRGQRGQGTVEYALVLLGAAAVALALVAWVARTGAVGRLFDTVVGRILSQA